MSGVSTCSCSSHPSFVHQRERRTGASRAHLWLPLEEIREHGALVVQLFLMEHRVVDLLRTNTEKMMAELIEADDPLVHVVLGMAPGRSGAKGRPQFVWLVPRWIVGIGESQSGERVDPLLHDQTRPQSLSRSFLRERDVVLLTFGFRSRRPRPVSRGAVLGSANRAPSSAIDSIHGVTLMHPAVGAWPVDMTRAGKRPSPPIRLAHDRIVAVRRWLSVRPMPRLRIDATDPMDPPVAVLSVEEDREVHGQHQLSSWGAAGPRQIGLSKASLSAVALSGRAATNFPSRRTVYQVRSSSLISSTVTPPSRAMILSDIPAPVHHLTRSGSPLSGTYGRSEREQHPTE
jgi:hypothetical protein